MSHFDLFHNAIKSVLIAGGLCALMSILPSMSVAQTPQPKPGAIEKQPGDFNQEIQPYSPGVGTLQACADPAVQLLATTRLVDTTLKINLAGNVCNHGTVPYTTATSPQIKVVIWEDMWWPPIPLSMRGRSTIIHQQMLPNLARGACVPVTKEISIAKVKNLGMEPSYNNIVSTAVMYGVVIYTADDQGLLTGPQNCTMNNDSKGTSNIFYMQIWDFSK